MEEIEAPPVAARPVDPKQRKRSRRLLILLGLMGLCSCGCVLLLPGVLLPWYLKARFPVKDVNCAKNQEAVAKSLLLYASDYDDRLPPSAHWVDVSISYVKDPNLYKCPAVSTSSFGFALNDWLGGTKIGEVADGPKTILLFEPMNSKINASGDPRADAANPPRHKGSNNFAFLDGHVEGKASP